MADLLSSKAAAARLLPNQPVSFLGKRCGYDTRCWPEWQIAGHLTTFDQEPAELLDKVLKV